MIELLEASAYFDPLAVSTLANLCRKGITSNLCRRILSNIFVKEYAQLIHSLGGRKLLV